MNSYGKVRYKDLRECRVCGMDSGERMVKEGSNEAYFVVCRSCGFQTKPHKTQSAATHAWNGGKR